MAPRTPHAVRGDVVDRSTSATAARLAALLATSALPLVACTTAPPQPREVTFSGGFSALPNLGVTAGIDQVFHREEETSYALELIGTYQPWDDEDLLSDGNPSAGPFGQVQIGVKRSHPTSESRWWNARGGAVWFRALGEPNIVQDPGDYLGLYAGAGFEWQFSEHMSMGPDLSLLFVSLEGSGRLDVVPQFAWRISWGY